MIKQNDGRRNRYQIQADLPLPEAASQEPAIGEVLAVLAGRRREAAANRDGTSLRRPAAVVVCAERPASMTEVTRP